VEGLTGLKLRDFLFSVDLLSPISFTGPVKSFQRRGIHYAEYRLAILDERDVYGEFAIFLQKLFRSIERIDQPEATP
jgi:hypothetical protein